MINDFSEKTNSGVIQYVPRSPTVNKFELGGMTTIEGAPDSKQAEVYRELDRKVISNENKYIPKPFDADDLMAWGLTWINRLLLEQKVSYDGIQDSGSGV